MTDVTRRAPVDSQPVFYVADSRRAVKTGVAGQIPCDNATFGDPACGTFKSCVWRAQ